MKSTCEIRKFTASDGYAFHYRHWRPEAVPHGYVVALHGIQSHSGWYEYSSSRLADAGFDVRFLDRRGSGLNGRERGHAPHPSRLLNDVAQVLHEVRFERDRCAALSPVVLLAVSWGSKLAAALAATRGELIDALALLYPGICSHVRANWTQRLLLRLANRRLREKSVQIPLEDAALFTDTPQWQEFIRDDALALHQTSVAFLNASLDLDRLAAGSLQKITVPMLVMLAGRDQIIDNSATRRFLGETASRHCTVIEYPQAAHTLEFEPERVEIFDELVGWLGAIASRATTRGGELSTVNPPHFDISAIGSSSSLFRHAI